MVRIPNNEHFSFLSIYAFSVIGVVFLCIFSFTSKPHNVQKEVVETPKEVPYVFFDTDVFKNVQVQAKAFIVYDLTDKKIIAAKNETTPLPLASLSKMMTAVSATLHKSKDESITISPKSIEGSYDFGLAKGQIWTLRELLKYTLVISSNDGAEVIADSFGSKKIFLDQMASDAKNLGLNFVFTDPAGRDTDTEIGGKGSAYEMAKLFGIARQRIPEILDATTRKRESVFTSKGKLSGIPNTNQSVESFPGVEVSKTGFTDSAGGNLGVVVDISLGHPVVIIVLGSTKEGRFKDVDTLYKALELSIQKPH